MKKKQGQIFTPDYIAKFMISLISNKDEGVKILEPSFGQGVFTKILSSKYQDIYGVEKCKNLFLKNKTDSHNNFNDDYLAFIQKYNNYFDIVIGNPPYIENNKIDSITKQNIKNLGLEIDNKEWDLYYYFIYGAIKQLKNKGELIFLVPVTFLTNTYAKSLRDFILDNGYISDIYSLEEEKIFKEASVEVIIMKFKKVKTDAIHNTNINIINKKINKGIDKLLQKDFIKNTIKFQKKDFFWNIYNNYTEKIFKRDINDFFDIYVGIVSGKDSAFLIKNESLFDDKEKEFIKPFFKAKNCTNNINTNNINKYIFFEKNKIQHEYELEANYPNIYRQLLSYKKELINRYKGHKNNYWDWATVRNIKLFKENNTQFFIPAISRKDLQGFTEYNGNMMAAGDVLTIAFKKGLDKKIKEELKSILNSNKFIKYINQIVPKKGNRKLFTQKFLTTIKI